MVQITMYVAGAFLSVYGTNSVLLLHLHMKLDGILV